MRNGSGAFLVDTNILVYLFDPRDLAKQVIARDLLVTLRPTRRTRLSAQCLAEFFNTVTGGFPPNLRLPVHRALREISRFADVYTVHDVTAPAVLDACRLVGDQSISIWDALICSVARLNGLEYILTEDSDHGRLLGGIRYLNPFDPAFDVSILL